MSVIIDIYKFNNNIYYINCPKCNNRIIVDNNYNYIICNKCDNIVNISNDDLKYYYNYDNKNDFHQKVLYLDV